MRQYFLAVLFLGVIHARPLKVLFVTDIFPFELRQFINNQITGFIDAGVDVTILANHTSREVNFPEMKEYNLLEKTYYGTLPEHLRSFDIIYCQFGDIFNQFNEIRFGDIKGKLVISFRGGDATGRFIKNPNCYDELFSKIDLALPVCESFAKNLIKHGCPKERVLVHKSGIDCKRFVFKKRSFPDDGLIKIVTVGRLCERKGHEEAISAVALLKKHYPKIRYDIVGGELNPKCRYRSKLIELIRDLDLEDTVFLRRRLSHKEVLQVLDEAHIFLLASITHNGDTEGIPNVIMEAFATGLPVVATKHGGIGELVKHNESGLLVEEGDVEGIADSLLYLIAHPEKWEQMALAGNKKVQLKHNKDILNRFIIKKFKNIVGIK